MRPCRNLAVLEHALRNDGPMLAVGGSHLRDAMTCAVEIVLAILIRHYGVVDKRSIYHNRFLRSILYHHLTTAFYSRSSNHHCCSQKYFRNLHIITPYYIYIRELLVHKFLSVHNHYTLVALVYLLTGEVEPLAIILLLNDDRVRDACRKA